MAEYIEREPLLNHLKHRVAPMSDGEQLRKGVNLALEILEEAVAMLPAADVAPVVHGYWIKTSLMFASSPTGRHGNVHACSNCGEQSGIGFKTPYCAICGAKMEELSNA